MKLPDKVATIVIGNPLIADASLQAGGILVVTGKGYGSTNLMALDRTGRVIMEKTVQVLGPTAPTWSSSTRASSAKSYSCAPECDRPHHARRLPRLFRWRDVARRRRTGGAAASGAAAAPH